MVVRGLVQGVFFRQSTRRVAVEQGVAGWIRNRQDGSVEALLEGEDAAVERVIAFMRDGPPGARVEAFELSDVPPQGLQGFRVDG